MAIAPGLLVADRFRLIRPLGQGGMGAVWLGQQIALDVPCAIKFIHEQAATNPELRARFEREAKAAAQLRSPHVVHILDHGLWEGSPYIAMELLEGEDLEHRLARCRVLPPRDALAIIVQVGRALSKAHAVGLVHRDLKPANIFITRDEDREIAKVLDFGVAKVKETIDGSTKTGAVLGTPYYMSPEQARGSKAIDHRSDLWALAVVTYQCLTGQIPFTGEALGDLFMKIIVEPLPMPSHFAPVPPGFDAWWARAASRDPADRFQNAKDFSESLALALGVSVAPGMDVSSPVTFDPALGPPPGGGTMAMMTPQQAIASYPRGAPTNPGASTPNARQDSFPSSPSGSAWQPAQSAPGYRPVTSSGPTPSPHLISTTPTPARASKSGGMIVGGGLVVALLGVGAFFALRSSGSAPDAALSPSASAVAAASAEPVATAPAAPATPPSVAPAASAAASAADDAPSADPSPPESPSARPAVAAATAPGRGPTHAPADPRGAAKAPKEPATPAKPSCNPPFTIDSKGAKHAKPECL